MIIQREKYLNLLLQARGNGLVKIVTGCRRCGKSFLLFKLFYDSLIAEGVQPDHIIGLSLDDLRNEKYRQPHVLLDFIDSQIKHDGKMHYVILDEVQLVDRFVELLLSLMHTPALDVYVSGSNSRFLSKDVVTEFRGRGDEIRVWPLSFKEFYSAVGGDREKAWVDFFTYGGLPQVLQLENAEKKRAYLKNLYELTYLTDVVERNKIKKPNELSQLVQILSSGIGAPTNPQRIANTFQSVEKTTISYHTIKDYIRHLQDAFLIEEALRYDVKGRKYIGTETKYYFGDMGLRNVILNFRQIEITHVMENIIYNELRARGYSVDVGVVKAYNNNNEGKTQRSTFEVDFVVNSGPDRIYIQSAYRMPIDEKVQQEHRPLLGINDNFKKMIIVGDNVGRKVNNDGIETINLIDFLLDEHSVIK